MNVFRFFWPHTDPTAKKEAEEASKFLIEKTAEASAILRIEVSKAKRDLNEAEAQTKKAGEALSAAKDALSKISKGW